jgi:hypothetical protein
MQASRYAGDLQLDRLARNVAFISNLMEFGVQFVAVDVPRTIHRRLPA